MPYNKEELLKLSVEERIKLAEELWESVDDEQLPVTDVEISIAEERYEAYLKNPKDGMSWEEFRKRSTTNMAFNIVVRSAVWIDIESAIDWYEYEVAGLGQRFFNSFEQAQIKIVNNPYYYSFVTKYVRRCPIKKFPYSVLYIVEEDTIYLLAVIHRRRSNAYIRKRIKR